jgi:hypothetical protein
MSEIPYTPLTRKIGKYFAKIQEVRVPEKVNSALLKTLGFKGGNDRYILGVLRYIGLIDSSGAPTELWKEYKDPTKAKVVLAKAITQGYRELFSTYADAYRKDRETLYAFFSSKTGKAKGTVDLMVSTFVNLCQLADFEAVPPEAPAEKEKIPEVKKVLAAMPAGLTINLNIQLTLPATEDATVYDKIFKALKENLLS